MKNITMKICKSGNVMETSISGIIVFTVFVNYLT